MLHAARIVVRQPYGMAALGKVERGWTVHILLPYNQNMATFNAIATAWAERGVKAIPIQPWEITGETRQAFDARLNESKALLHGYEGFKELAHFDPVFYPYLPKETLKDVGKPMRGATLLGTFGVIGTYLDKHPEVRHLFQGSGGSNVYFCLYLPRHCQKHKGNWIYLNAIDIVNHGVEFPADVWNMIEETIAKPVPQVSEGTFTDPEGTNISWQMTRGQAMRWAAYAKLPVANNHMFLYPLATDTTRFRGVIAGTANHIGFMPRMKVHLSDHGRVTKVEGGGRTGDFFRMLVESPRLNKLPNGEPVCFPGVKECGFWFLSADGMGTNPKKVRNMITLTDGTTDLPNVWERERGGVQHFSFTSATGPFEVRLPDVEKAIKEGKGVSFYNADPQPYAYAYKHKLPMGHTNHIHNYFNTLRWRLRDTGEWITVTRKGQLTAYANPEVRALAAKYGDPDTLFSYDWIPAIPGINVEGNYAAYAADPWRWIANEWSIIRNGTYRYFVADYQLTKAPSRN